jgi:hypothetical protein
MARTKGLLKDLAAGRAGGAEESEFHDDVLHMVAGSAWA